jgi:hypothetical protein
MLMSYSSNFAERGSVIAGYAEEQVEHPMREIASTMPDIRNQDARSLVIVHGVSEAAETKPAER